MKKKFEIFKSLQLALYILITGASLVVIFTNDELYQMVGRDPSVCFLCMMLWAALALSYLSVFWDFSTHSSLKKDFYELEYVARNDHIAGIANRYSCDAMIEKYINQPLGDHICSVMFELANLREINEGYGHDAGNDAILEFSNTLHTASLGLCFVGRNGGNKFMALFEDCTEEKLNTFLVRVQNSISVHNAHPDLPRIEYRKGYAFSKEERCASITQLISLSDRRLNHVNDALTGISNRAGCDEIINQYIDKPLPDHIGCIMLDITNIREINARKSRSEGNQAICHFGDALREASTGLCFVGRNGGTKFLALFEDCTEEKMQSFLAKVREKVDLYNRDELVCPLLYDSACAFHEDSSVSQINQLVALADRRLRERQQ